MVIPIIVHGVENDGDVVVVVIVVMVILLLIKDIRRRPNPIAHSGQEHTQLLFLAQLLFLVVRLRISCC